MPGAFQETWDQNSVKAFPIRHFPRVEYFLIRHFTQVEYFAPFSAALHWRGPCSPFPFTGRLAWDRPPFYSQPNNGHHKQVKTTKQTKNNEVKKEEKSILSKKY